MEKTLKQLIAEMDRIEASEAGDDNDAFIQGIDQSFGQSSIAKKIGFSPTGELYKALYRAIKAIMPDAPEEEIKARAKAATKAAEQS